MDGRDRITVDLRILVGKPVVRETRISSLPAGLTNKFSTAIRL